MPYRFIKRLMDVAVASVCLVLFFPLLLVLALAIRITMGSPVLFPQDRPGLNGGLFRIVKFRTMTDRVDESGDAAPDEARLTRLGLFLRAFSLDELPELWNVLVGDMSLVGPRPLLARYLDRYTEFQARRHEIRPGITGWAQVNGRNATSWQERFEMDVWYVDNASLWLDLRILARTVGKVVKKEGINQPGVATMGEFLGDPSPLLPPATGGRDMRRNEV